MKRKTFLKVVGMLALLALCALTAMSMKSEDHPLVGKALAWEREFVRWCWTWLEPTIEDRVTGMLQLDCPNTECASGYFEQEIYFDNDVTVEFGMVTYKDPDTWKIFAIHWIDGWVSDDYWFELPLWRRGNRVFTEVAIVDPDTLSVLMYDCDDSQLLLYETIELTSTTVSEMYGFNAAHEFWDTHFDATGHIEFHQADDVDWSEYDFGYDTWIEGQDPDSQTHLEASAFAVTTHDCEFSAKARVLGGGLYPGKNDITPEELEMLRAAPPPKLPTPKEDVASSVSTPTPTPEAKTQPPALPTPPTQSEGCSQASGARTSGTWEHLTAWYTTSDATATPTNTPTPTATSAPRPTPTPPPVTALIVADTTDYYDTYILTWPVPPYGAGMMYSKVADAPCYPACYGGSGWIQLDMQSNGWRYDRQWSDSNQDPPESGQCGCVAGCILVGWPPTLRCGYSHDQVD